MTPTYIMICCTPGCLAKEAHTRTKSAIQDDPLSVYKYSEQALYTPQNVTRFYTIEQLRDPRRLHGMELAGWSTCGNVPRLGWDLRELLDSRVRQTDPRTAPTLGAAAKNPDGTWNGAKALSWLSEALRPGKGVPVEEVEQMWREIKEKKPPT